MEKKFKRVPREVPIEDLTPLNISCGSSKCAEGLHCFQVSNRATQKWGLKGVCKECGMNLIDWDRVHKNNISDARFIFESMRNELIRHVFWHMKIDKEAIEYALQRGRELLETHARKQLKAKIGRWNELYDGRQTPLMGREIINYAQHATATCCRKCLALWHGFDRTKMLTEEQLEFCTKLVMLYVEEKSPGLSDEGTITNDNGENRHGKTLSSTSRKGH
jgi:hypothetical protein